MTFDGSVKVINVIVGLNLEHNVVAKTIPSWRILL
jgi:hypothetical protein